MRIKALMALLGLGAVLLLIAGCGSNSSSNGTRAIGGTVSSSPTSAPISGATVTLTQNGGTPLTTTTDLNGKYSFSGVPQGPNTVVTASATGFTTMSTAPFTVTGTI